MQTQGASTSATAHTGLDHWLPLIAVCLTMFIVTIDSTMMNVAISAIVDDLGTTLGAVQAGISIYSLVMAAFMTAGGKIASQWSFANGYARTVIFALVASTVDTADVGIATGVMNMTSQLGSAAGTTEMSERS